MSYYKLYEHMWPQDISSRSLLLLCLESQLLASAVKIFVENVRYSNTRLWFDLIVKYVTLLIIIDYFLIYLKTFQRIEKTVYMSVRSFDDYHKMLAEKIWKIQKQLDEQRQVW